MLSITVRYVAALVVLVVGDILWLGYFAHAVFQPTLKPILRDEIDWRAAVLFYLLYPVGIAVFAVAPALAGRSAWLALGYGLLFGFLAYMTYDATNYATISAWTIRLAVLDVGWGTFISGVAGLVSYAVTRAIVRA
jgi:uncharacterized membrane protein